MAIYYGIFAEGEKQAAFDRLVEIIHKDGDGVYCGVLGIRVLFHVLSDFGRTDLAFRMITRPEFPSYGYMMRLYDASLWESFVPDEGMPASRNHHFLGDVISWFMKNLVGIRLNPYAENVNEVHFAPKFIEELDHAQGSHMAPAGKISAQWQRDGEDILYTVTVPEGMQAELMLESGWKTEEGYTWRQPKGTVTYRLIREEKPDTRRMFSDR
jgi:alpha-L-rhamnosidase